jgi:hypothetical protein
LIISSLQVVLAVETAQVAQVVVAVQVDFDLLLLQQAAVEV